MTQVYLALDIFACQKEQAREKMQMFEAENSEDGCLEDTKNTRFHDDKAFNLIIEQLPGGSIPSLHQIPQIERRAIIKRLKSIEGISIRQIVRITGLTYYEVYKA
jgi:hypothetical protein